MIWGYHYFRKHPYIEFPLAMTFLVWCFSSKSDPFEKNTAKVRTKTTGGCWNWNHHFIDNLSPLLSFFLMSKDRRLVMSSNFDRVQSWAQQNDLISGLKNRVVRNFHSLFFRGRSLFWFWLMFFSTGWQERTEERIQWLIQPRRLSRLEPPKFRSEGWFPWQPLVL